MILITVEEQMIMEALSLKFSGNVWKKKHVGKIYTGHKNKKRKL